MHTTHRERVTARKQELQEPIIKEPVVKEELTIKEKSTLGFLQDPEGDFSSGRLIKVLSFIMAGATGLGGGIALMISAPNSTLASYCLKLAAMFLGVASGTEVVQKVLGK